MFEEETRKVNHAAVNRLHNSTNPYQGAYKKVLCVCSAGILRSPTAAWILSQPPYNFNTRAVGVSADYALIPVCVVTLNWCDEIVVMEDNHKDRIIHEFKDKVLGFDKKPIIVLDIEDRYPYRDPKLVRMITARYNAQTGFREYEEITSMEEVVDE